MFIVFIPVTFKRKVLCICISEDFSELCFYIKSVIKFLQVLMLLFALTRLSIIYICGNNVSITSLTNQT